MIRTTISRRGRCWCWVAIKNSSSILKQLRFWIAFFFSKGQDAGTGFHLTDESTNAPLLVSCAQARQERCPIMAEMDTLHCSAAPLLLPLFEFYRVQSCWPLISNSAFLFYFPPFLLTLMFTPQSVHRKPIVAMPSGRHPAHDASSIFILVPQSSYSVLFLTFALAWGCTLGHRQLLQVAVGLPLRSWTATQEIACNLICKHCWNGLFSSILIWHGNWICPAASRGILDFIGCRVMCISCSVVAELIL